MTHSFNTRAVVVVALLAVVLPIVARIISSPLTLLLISPFVILLFAVAFILLNIFLGHILDTQQVHPQHTLLQAARPFAFSTPAAWQAVLTRSQWSQNTPQSFPPLCPDAPHVSAALNDILILSVRDFVLAWYKDLSSSPSFPIAVSSLLHDSLQKLIDRSTGIDVSTLLVKRVLPKVTAHIEQFRQSEVTLRGAGLERKLTQSEELDLLLASRYVGKGEAKLHPAIDNLSTTFTKQTEEAHLRQLLEKALPFILPEKEANSKVMKIVAREIAACSVLYPIMDMVSDPDFWNRAIDQVVSPRVCRQYSKAELLLLGWCCYTPTVSTYWKPALLVLTNR